MSDYQLGHQWRTERERLSSLEAMLDPSTIECIEKTGIQNGWHCLEVGAGGASMTSWLCKRVGSQGHVVATDLETDFLEVIREPNLEIRQHNIVTDVLEENTFDLVYTRAVLEHLSARDAVLDKLIQALKPGGCLLVASGDYISFTAVDPQAASIFDRGRRAFLRVMEAAGFDAYYGRKVSQILREKKCVDVQMQGFVNEWGGPRPGTLIWIHLFERLKDKVLAANLLTKEEVGEFQKLVSPPGFCGFTAICCYAWGRKPNQQ